MVEAYVIALIRLHEVPRSIISYRDTRFLAIFWKRLQEAFGTKLKLSTSFHPATDGQTKITIQVLEDMFRACVMEFQGTWEDRLTLIKWMLMSQLIRLHTRLYMDVKHRYVWTILERGQLWDHK